MPANQPKIRRRVPLKRLPRRWKAGIRLTKMNIAVVRKIQRIRSDILEMINPPRTAKKLSPMAVIDRYDRLRSGLQKVHVQLQLPLYRKRETIWHEYNKAKRDFGILFGLPENKLDDVISGKIRLTIEVENRR